MKYVSENSLTDFIFHDAELKFLEYFNNNLTVSVKHLKVHKLTQQNKFTDMEISLAQIVFKNFSVKSFGINNNNHLSEGSPVTVEGTDASTRLLSELQHGIHIYELGKYDNQFHYLDACGTEPWFTARFHFDSVTVQWNEYCRKTQYEKQLPR